MTATTSLSCGWPYTVEECVKTDAATGSRRLSREFEEFVVDPSHWSFDKSVLETFPDLTYLVRIRGAGDKADD